MTKLRRRFSCSAPWCSWPQCWWTRNDFTGSLWLVKSAVDAVCWRPVWYHRYCALVQWIAVLLTSRAYCWLVCDWMQLAECSGRVYSFIHWPDDVCLSSERSVGLLMTLHLVDECRSHNTHTLPHSSPLLPASCRCGLVWLYCVLRWLISDYWTSLFAISGRKPINK